MDIIKELEEANVNYKTTLYFLEQEKKQISNLQANLEMCETKDQSCQRDKVIAKDRIKFLEDDVRRLEANITSTLQNEWTSPNMNMTSTKFLQDFDKVINAKLTSLQNTLKNATTRGQLLNDYVNLLETNITTMMQMSARNKFLEDYVKLLEANITTLQKAETEKITGMQNYGTLLFFFMDFSG